MSIVSSVPFLLNKEEKLNTKYTVKACNFLFYCLNVSIKGKLI